ncbi:MAG TPA: ABC transporter permease [Thermoanaerobaculia bacterium]|nr:ABC transporter permease [Thermoanaerobaculia bacterium]
MNKLFAVMKREYLQSVRRKMFIIMTLLMPFLMAGITILPGLMMTRGMGKKRIAVLDATGQLQNAFVDANAKEPVDAKKEARKALSGGGRERELPAQFEIEYRNVSGTDLTTAAKPYLARLTRDNDAADKLEGVLAIPAAALANTDVKMDYYSRSATDLVTQERLGRLANKSLQRLRLGSRGIDPHIVDTLLREVEIEAVQLSRTGEQKKGGDLNFLVALIFGILLVLPSFVYGQETMRGIVQEKSDRVVEVLVSSVTPMQLLTGKILGVAMVGLTQITVWVTMMGLLGLNAAPMAAMSGINLSQFIRPSVFIFFFVFFILAYLTYVCVFSIAGAACNSEREAQQFVMPVMMLMLTPWFLMMPIIMNPDAPFAVAFSLAPVFGPMTMFVRTVVSEPPMWHVAVSILVSIATITVFFWITAKIFRVGILSYGKRPTIPELWRWVKVA